jgi:hypothetical protein
LDDYKFDRATTGQILRELEAKIDPEMISGGPPESTDEEIAVSSEAHADAEPERTE